MPDLIRTLREKGITPKSEIGLQKVLIGEGALSTLPHEVDSFDSQGSVLVVQDSTPMNLAGSDLKSEVERLLAADHVVNRVIVGDPDGHVVADRETLGRVRAAAAGSACVVAVGSGTVADIAKHACHENGGMPLVVVQTAASVNGFADDMAVLLKDGVKRTVPSAWPRSLIIDTRVLADAPFELTRSGYAEMMAMFTAPLDWRLSAIVGIDDSYSSALVDLYQDPQALFQSAQAFGRGDTASLDVLAELLTRSGLAMAIAGRTAPLSGTEHMISHLVDMSAASEGSEVGLHGAQVGVAAVIAAVVAEWLRHRMDRAPLQIEVPDPARSRTRVERAFSRLDAAGAAAEECWADYSKKLAFLDRVGVEPLRDRVAVMHETIGSTMADPATLVEALRAVGAPTRFSELSPPVSPDRARWAVASAHLMRSRFCIADLADLTGNWQLDDVDEVLQMADERGGGL